jgi:hypothetical protein
VFRAEDLAMLTLSEIIITFTPILIFFLLALIISWQITLTAKGKVRVLSITSLIIWIFLTLVFCVFTLSYLSPHVSGGVGSYLLGVLVYGIIGLGFITCSDWKKNFSIITVS